MTISLSSNIASLGATRRLNQSSFALAQTQERLSSGLRINRSSDDAAGLSIADGLRNQGSLYSVAMRNVQDGISVLNLMDSSIQSQVGILDRLSELAQQSASGSISNAQRVALNTEYQSLVQEYGRIGATTKFNGVELLSASKSNSDLLNFQVGITGSSQSQLSVSKTDSEFFSGTITYSGSSPTPDGGDVGEIAAGFDGQVIKIRATAEDPISGVVEERDLLLAFIVPDTSDAAIVVLYSADSEIEGQYNVDGVAGGFSINSATGKITGGISSPESGDTKFSFSYMIDSLIAEIEIDFAGARFFNTTDTPSARASMLELSGVETSQRSQFAIDIIDARRQELSSQMSEVGASLSRLEVSFNLLSTSREGALAAESRIRDADIASEVADYARLQIAQQAGVAVLAQANQQPALALQLLQL